MAAISSAPTTGPMGPKARRNMEPAHRPASPSASETATTTERFHLGPMRRTAAGTHFRPGVFSSRCSRPRLGAGPGWIITEAVILGSSGSMLSIMALRRASRDASTARITASENRAIITKNPANRDSQRFIPVS